MVTAAAAASRGRPIPEAKVCSPDGAKRNPRTGCWPLGSARPGAQSAGKVRKCRNPREIGGIFEISPRQIKGLSLFNSLKCIFRLWYDYDITTACLPARSAGQERGASRGFGFLREGTDGRA